MSHSIRFTSYDLLPGRVLTRIFEHLFWVPMRDHNMRALSLPLGHQCLVPILSVSHSWRVRAAKLFYRVATVVAGSSGGDTTTWAIPTQRHMSMVKTNIELILNSGYAPKTTQLLVFSTESLSPTEMAAAVSLSRFCEFVWPSITHLYFYHPLILVIASDMESANDTAIAALNHSLAVSMPHLSHINALSNTRDSFGLFALDDLIIAKLSQLRALTVLTRVPLRLGAEELPRFLTRLTIRSSLADSCIVSVPRTASASLISLDIGPISPDDVWGPFSSGISDFTSLRELRLAFCANPAARLSEDSRYQHRHLHKHRNRRSSRDSATSSGWPLFPRLNALAVEGYPYETAYFLENFPRSQLTRLAIRRCDHKISKFALTPFTGLISFSGDVPDCNPSTTEGSESAIEEWISQTMQADMPTMRSLSLSVGPEVFIELPAQFGLSGLRHLSLNTGLRMSEVEKILLSFDHLRSLRVTVTEVLSRTHEYLSRTTRHKKYLPAELQERPWLSITLEDLEVWLLEPSPGRQHRALLKIVHMAMRVPSILRIATQREYLGELRELGQHMPAVQITDVSIADSDRNMWC
ncbi:hypothetical protein GGI19_000483 [Coemansia pectinata]|uniref:Uncharacterized protein n=1 Tax=Coemansia pectinata TaxID=1052879 RepID=A0A9W8H0T2_9FUNG|nr:hypothetical protein GGI19_000483 [Coemansia pectinata]